MNNLKETDIFQGVWPAMLTPVNDAGDVQVKSLEKLIGLLIEQGVDGLYLLGSSGQGFLFNENQRKKMAELALRIVDGHLPVIVQVGAINTNESICLAKHAASNGAAGISSVGPIYYASSPQMGITHYRRIAESSDLPFFPYKIGSSPMSREVIDELLEVENIKGLKLTTTDMLEISNLCNYVGNKWKVFSGADELLCQASLSGTAGAIGTTYNLLGKTCKHVRKRFLEGDVKRGMEFMLLLQKVIEMMLPCIWTFFRKGMKLRHGIDIGIVKPPLLSPNLPINDEELLELILKLEKFGNE